LVATEYGKATVIEGYLMSAAFVTSRREPLDCVVRLVTPERIVVLHPLAGPARRFVAYSIDLLLLVSLITAVLIVTILLAAIGSASVFGPAFVAYFILSWGYGAFCEGLFNGQTVGKRCLGIRVVSDRGVPITGAQAVLRNVVGAVDGLVPFFFLIGLSSMILTRRFQRLGDLAAGTMVVIEEQRSRRGFTRIREPAVDALLTWLPGRIPAGSDLARVLSDYVDARNRFGPLRRAELAEPLARPLRVQLGLGPSASSDAVLCAVYHRIIIGD
jgi:uncharacterized RDD family membrane protein YckC